MRLRAFSPQKEPGFRLSVFDVALGVSASVASCVIANAEGLAALWPLPIHIYGTFFLFCNVFRIGTRQEFFWCASFVVILGLAMLAGARPYPLVLAFTIPTALLAVFMSARRGKYDGVLQEYVRKVFEPSAPP